MELKNASLIAVVLFTLMASFKSYEKRKKIMKLITNRSWLINLVIIICFIVYTEVSTYNNKSDESKKIKSAIKKSIIAFIIAVFSEIGLTIAPFWLVFVLAYYMEDWI